MANRASKPITLPWKRPEKGVSVAEMGASFRVEQREDGWHCTVNVGRRAEVLATGLRRLRDAQCRAEAHAATLPAVAAAREKLAAEEKKGASPAKQRTASTQTDPSPAGPVTAPGVETPPLAFEQVSDGCICGKIEGGTWVADPGGGVSVPTGTDLAVAQEICRVATAHFTARRSATTPAKAAASTKPAGKRGGRKSKPTTAKPVMAKPVAAPEKPAAKAEPVEKPAPAKKAKPPKNAKSKPAKEPAAPTSAGARQQAKAPRTRKGRAASKKAAKTTTPKAPAATKEKQAATPTPPAKAAAKVKKPAARRRKVGKRGKASAPEEKQVATPTPPAKEERVSKKPAKNSKPAKDACGCVTWAAVDGKIRGEAKHGTFVVEPEGKRHALYFYDADGQSRHLESGEAGKLRKVAEEMAARGQPVLRAAASGVDDAALMRAFLGDDA